MTSEEASILKHREAIISHNIVDVINFVEFSWLFKTSVIVFLGKDKSW